MFDLFRMYYLNTFTLNNLISDTNTDFRYEAGGAYGKDYI